MKLTNLKNCLVQNQKALDWFYLKKIDYAFLMESKIILGGKDDYSISSKRDTVVLPR